MNIIIKYKNKTSIQRIKNYNIIDHTGSRVTFRIGGSEIKKVR